ncbi:hypothetical protein LINGRAHAP2_LOCUS7064, partial [Linum grandiflorum]
MDLKRCEKAGHRKADCPLKEHALQAIWGDSDEDSDESDDEENIVAHMAIVDTEAENETKKEEVCYRADEGSQQWVLDSRCSHHMTGDRSLFCELNSTDRDNVTFGDNRSCKILGV